MSRSLRIIVADDERDMCDFFQMFLPTLGHELVAVVQNGRELVEQSRNLRPDLVITDIRMPDMSGTEAALELYKETAIPVILVSAYSDRSFIERGDADPIMAYLTKPIKETDLELAIALAMKRFEQFRALQHEAADLRQALEDRKVIERAKGILMKRGRLDELEAFRRLQKLASDKGQRLIEAAQMVLAVEEASRPPGKS